MGARLRGPRPMGRGVPSVTPGSLGQAKCARGVAIAYALVVDGKCVDRASTFVEAWRLARKESYNVEGDVEVKHILWSYATWQEYRTVNIWRKGKRIFPS
jgi:hypothetical protein